MNNNRLKQRFGGEINLAISGAVVFDDPTSFRAEGFQDLVVVAVFGELESPLRSEACEYLGGDCSSPPLSPLVVLSLIPRR